MLLKVIFDNMIFDLIVLCLVFFGLVALRLLDSKRRLKGPKMEILFFLIFSLIFFNLIFITDLFFGFPKIPFYSIMAFLSLCVLGTVFFFIFRNKELFDRRFVTPLLICWIIGPPIYILQGFFTFIGENLWDILGSVLALVVLISMNQVVIRFLIKEGKQRNP